MKLVLIFFMAQFNFSATEALAEAPESPQHAATYVDQTPAIITQRTEHGHDSWCNSAENKIAVLNEVTSAELNNIKKTAQEINDYKGQKTLLEGFLKVRDDYETSFRAFLDQQPKMKTDYYERLTNFKKIINSGLVLTIVNHFAEDKQHADLSIKQLCKLDEYKKHYKLCSEANGWFLKFSDEEIAVLDATLNNARLAMAQAKNPEQLQANLTVIYNSIPQNISPETMLNEISSHLNPNLIYSVNHSTDKEMILECIKATDFKNENCRQLVKEDKAKETLKKTILAGMNSVHAKFVGEKLDENLNDLKEGQKIFEAKKKETMNKTSREFLSRFDKYSAADRTKMDQAGFKMADLENFRKACIADNVEKLNINDCEEATKKFIDAFRVKTKSLDDLVVMNEEKLKKLTSSVGPLAINEKMKQYLSQRYIRFCRNADLQKAQSSLNCKNINQTFAGIDSLDAFVGNIVGTMSENSLSKNKGEHGPFSKSELDVYLNYCKETSTQQAYRDVCDNIITDVEAVKGKKEAKDWEQFHKDYLVVHDKTDSRGYSIYPKRSNWGIFGEQLKHSIPAFSYMWMNNEQMNFQIEQLTTQGLMQKQLMYMNSFDSPWMNQMPYFQNSYYQLNNFPTASSGFNFAQ